MIATTRRSQTIFAHLGDRHVGGCGTPASSPTERLEYNECVATMVGGPVMERTEELTAAVVGVADHAGWAILVTATREGALIDRRRVALLDDELPKLPHHHEAQGLPPQEGVALVGKVRASAERNAAACLDALARDISVQIVGVAIRKCPSLPETIEERITNYRAQCVADTVMYRHALADAAVARGWLVHWYDPKRVFAEAAGALDRPTIDDLLRETGAALGPPWQKDHRTAMAAAIAAAGKALS